jgi:hypothetical protein
MTIEKIDSEFLVNEILNKLKGIKVPYELEQEIEGTKCYTKEAQDVYEVIFETFKPYINGE